MDPIEKKKISSHIQSHTLRGSTMVTCMQLRILAKATSFSTILLAGMCLWRKRVAHGDSIVSPLKLGPQTDAKRLSFLIAWWCCRGMHGTSPAGKALLLFPGHRLEGTKEAVLRNQSGDRVSIAKKAPRSMGTTQQPVVHCGAELNALSQPILILTNKQANWTKPYSFGNSILFPFVSNSCTDSFRRERVYMCFLTCAYILWL